MQTVSEQEAKSQIKQAHPTWGEIIVDMYYTKVKLMDAELGVCSFGENYIPDETYLQYKMWSQLNG